MESFFSGTVIILYFLSRYAAEPIFVLCCCLPALFGAAAMLFLRLGSAGAMLSARNRARRYWRSGVVAGRERALFYRRCIKRTPPAYRAAYELFLEGKLSAADLSMVGIESVRCKKGWVSLGALCVGAFSSLAVFLTFYFLVPIGETLLRAAVCAFHGVMSAISLHILSFAYVARAERAAARFSSSLDDLLLRKKDNERSKEPRLPESESTLQKADQAEERSQKGEDPDLIALKAMLRDLEGSVSR